MMKNAIVMVNLVKLYVRYYLDLDGEVVIEQVSPLSTDLGDLLSDDQIREIEEQIIKKEKYE